MNQTVLSSHYSTAFYAGQTQDHSRDDDDEEIFAQQEYQMLSKSVPPKRTPKFAVSGAT